MSQNNFLWQKLLALQFWRVFFNLLFLWCFTPVHFSQHPLPKNALPFFCQSSIWESFSRFLLRYNFYPSLINVPIICIEGFETSLLTLLGVSLVLWRRKADNAHSKPLFYGPSPLNSQHLHFQFPITSLLKILLEVVAIGRKNAGKGYMRTIWYSFLSVL